MHHYDQQAMLEEMMTGECLQYNLLYLIVTLKKLDRGQCGKILFPPPTPLTPCWTYTPKR